MQFLREGGEARRASPPTGVKTTPVAVPLRNRESPPTLAWLEEPSAEALPSVVAPGREATRSFP
jgi:hypothetical protein